MIRLKASVLIIGLMLTGCSNRQQIRQPHAFVSTDWLLEHLNDSSLVILHVGTKETFDTLHIPNAQIIPAIHFIIDNDSLRHEIPDIIKIDSILESYGVGNQSRIVLYHENERVIPLAARIFLTLDYVSLGDRTSVLNGGLKQWLSEGKRTTDTAIKAIPGDLNLEVNTKILIDAQGVEKLISNPDHVIIDARPVAFYSGFFDTIENRYIGGHIEGTANLPFDYLFSESEPYLLREDAELRKEFEKLGVDDEKTVVHYCGSGIWASANYLVSKHLGYRSLFYDGSFEEWESLRLPVIKPVENTSAYE